MGMGADLRRFVTCAETRFTLPSHQASKSFSILAIRQAGHRTAHESTGAPTVAMVTNSALKMTSTASLCHRASAALPARRRGSQAVRAASTRLPPPGTAQPNGKDGREGLVGIGVTLALTGASIGTYMDGIHTQAQVLIYDQLPLVHGGLHTSAVVPPLLAAYYLVLGGLVLKADDWMQADASTQASYRRCNLGTMCLSFA